MDEITSRIAQLIERRIGVNIDSIGEANFQKIIREKMKGLGINELKTYYTRLDQYTLDFQQLVEEIIVPETWFFRNPTSLEFLQYYVTKILLPVMNRSIKILSVPCSSGEEPYSIAIELLRVGLSSQQFTIDGIDISQIALKKAQEGIYKSYSFRGLESNDPKINAYFETHGSWLKIKRKVKDCVKFFYGNMLNENCFHEKYDIIFCKNLLIYMSPLAQKQILNTLDRILLDQGILIVSPYEVECIKKTGYFPSSYPKSYAFQKNPFPGMVKKEDIEPKKPAFSEKVIQIPEELIVLEKKEQIKEAKQLADSGQFEEASKICKQYLERNGPHAEIYFILALMAHALEKDEEASEYLLKTLYLEPEHYEALIYLALLAEKKDEVAQAELFFNRANRLLHRANGKKRNHFS